MRPPNGWRRDEGLRPRPGQQVRFAVSRRWKGARSRTVMVRTRLIGEACGYPFEPGKEYLVYVMADREIQTGICTGTKRIEEAAEDLKHLEQLR